MVHGEDDYTRELQMGGGMALWYAELTDGRVAVQDDGRPGLWPPQAWPRLAAHVGRAGLGVRRLWLQFRGHAERPLPESAEGYFFRKSALAVFRTEGTRHSYLLGHLHDGEVVVQRWSTPDLRYVETFVRDPADPLGVGDCLIRNRR